MAAAASCALLGGAAPAAASISRAHLKHGLTKQMHRVGGASGAWVYDLDASDHGMLFSWASETQRVLASNSKLFTTAAVLHRYGASGKLETDLYPQPRPALHDHAIRGDLVLVGAGDGPCAVLMIGAPRTSTLDEMDYPANPVAARYGASATESTKIAPRPSSSRTTCELWTICLRT